MVEEAIRVSLRQKKKSRKLLWSELALAEVLEGLH
jgi:hypothetical protein